MSIKNRVLPMHRDDRLDYAQRAAVVTALKGISYEVIPLKGAGESVMAHVPTDIALTVTTTEAKGLEPTLRLAERLSTAGYVVAPHIAARLVRDQSHLAEIAARLDESDIDGIFVIGGDAREPVGQFEDALGLLKALHSLGHKFQSIGIGGYPEGHGHIASASMERALKDKAPYATHLVTQLCFAPKVTANWAGTVKAHGVGLPIRVGIPGVVNRQKLIRISAGLGLGQSARFIQKQQSMLWRFFVPGGYSPDPLVRRLVHGINPQHNNVAGFHVFTFNELAATEMWRRAWLARLDGSPSSGRLGTTSETLSLHGLTNRNSKVIASVNAATEPATRDGANGRGDRLRHIR